MATYHLELKKISKGKGGSALQQYKYISRTSEFKRKGDDLVSLLNFNMPKFAEHTAKNYWESADIYERKNACVAHSLIVALQRELSISDSEKILKKFVEDNFPNQPVTVAIHNDENNNNPHAHLIISGKLLSPYSMNLSPETFYKRRSKNKQGEETGGAEKVSRDLNPERLEELRTSWAKVNNVYLRNVGVAEISEKTLEAQGLERAPRHRIQRAEYIKISQELNALNEEQARLSQITQKAITDNFKNELNEMLEKLIFEAKKQIPDDEILRQNLKDKMHEFEQHSPFEFENWVKNDGAKRVESSLEVELGFEKAQGTYQMKSLVKTVFDRLLSLLELISKPIKDLWANSNSNKIDEMNQRVESARKFEESQRQQTFSAPRMRM